MKREPRLRRAWPASDHARWPIQVFRIAALIVPSAVAWYVAFTSAEKTRLVDAVTLTLGPLWFFVAAALVARTVDAIIRRRRGSGAPLLDQIDVLTASGSALAWASALAIVLSVWIGYASLSVVGLMGTALLDLLVLRTCLIGSAEDLLREGKVARRFVPEVAVKGSPVTEEVTFSGVRVPAGFRLFATGRVGRRWPVSRYAIGDAESGGEILIESDLGPAHRGEHHAPPLELWYEDNFGLCRTSRVVLAPARLTVLPRPRSVDGARVLLAQGGVDLVPRQAQRLPTEGSLNLREYQPGDDARRIHWVRSLTAQQIVVRVPDETPPDQPSVRVVLGTFLPGVEALTCNAPAELLDAMVAVWLGIGRALLEAGARVTLVTAVSQGDKLAPIARRLTEHTLQDVLRLGAAARWQSTVPVGAMLDREPAIVVSCRLLPDPPGAGKLQWIVVPEPVWTRFDEPRPTDSLAELQYPMGSADNRWSRRRRERIRRERARRDHTALTRVTEDLSDARPGTFVARPAKDGRIALEALR